MGVKKTVTERLNSARSFADKVRSIYQGAYDKALEASRDGLGELVKVGESLEPKIRAAIDGGVHGAQAALDGINKTLADKSIPAFRRGAVSKEQLDEKSRNVVESIATKTAAAKPAPVKRKTTAKKAEAKPAAPKKATPKKAIPKKATPKKIVAKKTAVNK